MQKQKKLLQAGFTLIELAIVLVIIGLMIGGISVGRGLIRSAELNEIVTQYDTFKKATRSFQALYNMLPGDENVAMTDKGNGNGKIEYSNGVITSSIAASTANAEGVNAWRHLASFTEHGLELINGNFAAVDSHTAASIPTPGSNAPTTKVNGSAIWAFDYNTINTVAGNYIFLVDTSKAGFVALPKDTTTTTGGTRLYAAATADVSALSPMQASIVDKKIDDGMGNSGIVAGVGGAAGACFNATSGVYITATSDAKCGLAFSL